MTILTIEMKKISRKTWFLFFLVAVFCLGLWYKLEYPQFLFLNLSVDKKEALQKAEQYLNSRGVETNAYLKAIVFNSDDWADRYLQKTIGFKKEREFFRKHNFEIFAWQVRFFKEFQVEEYIVAVSPQSAQVLGFGHIIEDVAPGEQTDKDKARLLAQNFLAGAFKIDFADYDFHEEKTKRFELRTDCQFSWEKKGVYIPWKEDEGGAKLLIGATVSGDKIMSFYKADLDVPEKFQRFIENQLISGSFLFSLYFLMLVFLITAAIIILIKRQDAPVIHALRRPFIYLAGFIIVVNFLDIFNELQNVLAAYPTSTALGSFLGIYLLKATLNLTVFTVIIMLPGLAAETLHSDVFADKPYSSFAHFIRSTFFSRAVCRAVLLGYLLFFIMLGMQAVIFTLGQKYCGVWKEWLALTQFSSSSLPFFGAFAIGVSASLKEEVVFRLFGISWGRKYFKNTVLAVIFSAIIWGFGHSQYAIFPVWFRGIEVSILGLFFGFIFVRYGLLPLITAHYLFDVFWGVCAYILGRSNAYLFGSALFILLLPLLFAAAAYLRNQPDTEREISRELTENESYNLKVLAAFILMKKSQGMSADSIREELIVHKWDKTLVDLAMRQAPN